MTHALVRVVGALTSIWPARGSLRTVVNHVSVAAAMVIGGCKVGPNYQQPAAPVSDTWLDMKAAPAGVNQPPEAPQWWRQFNDPILTSLVDEAMAQNLTLRQAGLRVIEARAVRGIAVGQFYPQTQIATGQISKNQISRNSPQGFGDRSFDDASVALQAAWELDFWGKFRRGIESADAALEASVADYDFALVVLAADVADDYVIIRSLQEQLQFTRDNVKAQQDTYELTKIRFNAGAVSELDVATAHATLSNTQSLIPQLEDSLRQGVLALCVLLGRTPSTLDEELGGSQAVPSAPAEIAVGIPADLLRRRPDVRSAERVAASLSAQIGVATADLYPAISVKGATGFESSTFQGPARSLSLGNLFDADSFAGFIGLDVQWPILNYGRIQNNIRAVDARFQQAIVAYQNSVLKAAAEVESGLSSFLRAREQSGFLAESVQAAQRTVELSLIQYRQGAVDFLRVNQAQVDLVDRQNSLVVARARVAQGAIAAYRALGGGWETRVGKEFVPQETIDEMRKRTNWGDILAPEYQNGKDGLFFKRPEEIPMHDGNQLHNPQHN